MTDASGNTDYDVTFDTTLPEGASTYVQATCVEKGSSKYSLAVTLFPANAVDLRMDITGPYFGQSGVPMRFTGLVANVGPTPATC
jgi:hypothetical protein